jgi:hypothetical protein
VAVRSVGPTRRRSIHPKRTSHSTAKAFSPAWLAFAFRLFKRRMFDGGHTRGLHEEMVVFVLSFYQAGDNYPFFLFLW